MASNTKVTVAKRIAKMKKSGRKRKNQQGAKSTLSAKELFEGIPEPSDAR